MAIDIANAIVRSSSNGVSIITNSTSGLSIESGTTTIMNNRPAFFAEGNNQNAWNSYTWSGAWGVMPFSNILQNYGSCYSSSTNRFTAPVSGVYWFTHTAFLYKNTDTSATSYVHPAFYVNGVWSSRTATSQGNLRIRLRSYYSGGYYADSQINNVFNLTAGDYVEVQHYVSSSLQYLGSYSAFWGALIG